LAERTFPINPPKSIIGVPSLRSNLFKGTGSSRVSTSSMKGKETVTGKYVKVGLYQPESHLQIFIADAKYIIEEHHPDFMMRHLSKNTISIELPKADNPRYGVPLFPKLEILQVVLTELQDYLIKALGKDGLTYTIIDNKLHIKTVSKEKANEVERFLRGAKCWFENDLPDEATQISILQHDRLFSDNSSSEGSVDRLDTISESSTCRSDFEENIRPEL